MSYYKEISDFFALWEGTFYQRCPSLEYEGVMELREAVDAARLEGKEGESFIAEMMKGTGKRTVKGLMREFFSWDQSSFNFEFPLRLD